MKTTSILAAVFVVCFLLGVGLVAMTPADAEAAAGIPSPCYLGCYEFGCSTGCTFPQVMHVKCYPDGRLAYPCNGPFNCRCVDIGCSYDLCAPE